MTDEINLHGTTDATAWASEFCKRWPSALCQIEGKEGISDGDDFEHTMVGWFANAIMAGCDSEAYKANARIAELEAAIKHVHYWLDLSPEEIKALTLKMGPREMAKQSEMVEVLAAALKEPAND